MKHIAYTGALMAALCVVNTGMAQRNSMTAPATPDQPQPPADNSQADYERMQTELKQQAEATRAQADAVQAQVTSSFDQNLGALTGRNYAFSFAGGSAGRGDSPLIIRSSDTDAKTLAMEQEDLTIMGRILEKAASTKDEDERPEAMGIKLFNVGGPSGARNMQIEGYGAIFMLSVNFPLVGPTVKADEGESKEPTNSTWDEAKREVYGQPGGADGDPFGPRFSKEEFDPKRVEKLKDALLDALKNASNMRGLKPDESVTVVVTSSTGRMGGFARTIRRGGSGGGSGGFGGSANPPVPPAASWSYGTGPNTIMNVMGGGGGSVQSVLTIRAKKSDIDAFAKGKATPDDYRKRATVLIY